MNNDFNQPHKFSAKLGDQEIVVQSGKLAGLAGGAVTVHMGETVILVTATGSKSPRQGISFFPLSVDFEERMYAAGRIPGSFFRREGRPSESAILLSRMVDRGLRPLFPKGFRNDVQVIVTALSHDDQSALDTMSALGASAALMISDVPFLGPVANVRIAMDADEQFIVNPTSDQVENSRLDLRVTGSADAIIMVECASDEVDEETMVRALELAHDAIQPLIEMQNQMAAEIGKAKMSDYPVFETPEEIQQSVRDWLGSRIEEAVRNSSAKEERYDALEAVRTEMVDAFTDENEEWAFDSAHAYDVFEKVKKESVRRQILDEGIRPDGRRPEEIRPLAAEVSLLPRAHGAGLFTRGETQVLSIATLGTLGDMQTLDDLGQVDEKRYMHHYNFPPFSTGETWPLRGPKRREIGHGALAENALRAMIPSPDEFPYTIRVVSEAISSNGSTSMASVCGSTLALLDAGVPLRASVAGIAMGLITDGERAQVLSDIQGLEDHLGDMDFKVAGTRKGINALQMDVKIKGLSMDLMRQALRQAHDGRMHILDVMEEAISSPREELSPYAPRIDVVKINPELIGKVIGPGGKTIRGIQEQTGAKIDIEEDGTVFIASTDQAGGRAARQLVEALTEEVELGKIYTGRVASVREGLGAFVEILPGTDGLVHISQLADYRVPSVEDVVKVGDEIMVMVTDIDSNNRVRLSRQAVLEGWDLETARDNDSGIGGRSGGGRDRGRGNDRGGRGRR
ncbi:MAG: polyribonucleotide nucleotidyltransferase [Anaerolineales bacterium]|nr:polyribonucleotide nucleotidyltransferase [Anaerolineales bacterium]MCB9128491.1 polyribonucleotide nucleotidyltransferase [Ardenticatenales bacterium]MCB9172669.1 polyribonucleotide nucleotidyltransferase [Ardenticatenales bacterium]